MAMAEQQQNRASSSETLSASSSEQELSQKATRAAVKGLPPTFPAIMSQQKSASAVPRRPSAEEMIEYYSRKGLDKQAATEKVIDDLQKALSLAVGRYPRKAQEMEKSVRSASGTLDSLATRLSAVEAKVDEKPDLGGVFVAGVAAGGFLQAVPHIVKAIYQVSGSVQDAISSKR